MPTGICGETKEAGDVNSKYDGLGVSGVVRGVRYAFAGLVGIDGGGVDFGGDAWRGLNDGCICVETIAGKELVGVLPRCSKTTVQSRMIVVEGKMTQSSYGHVYVDFACRSIHLLFSYFHLPPSPSCWVLLHPYMSCFSLTPSLRHVRQCFCPQFL